MTSTDAPTAGGTGTAELELAAAGATPAALLEAGAAAALVAGAAAAALAAAALVATAALDDVALPADFVLAHPATNSAAIPRKTVALTAGDFARIGFFIRGLLHVWPLGGDVGRW